MSFVGIDVGAKGGMALLSVDGAVLHLRPMPSMCGKFNVALMLESLREIDEHARLHSKDGVRLAVMEHVGAFPGQGVSSMFSFGYNAGAIEGCVSALRWPYQLVRPQLWQKMMHVGIYSAQRAVQNLTTGLLTRSSWPSTQEGSTAAFPPFPLRPGSA
ncbi:hypothetical protein EBX31_09510 [bacterium]|nr:hypothetical protein [bacterium]